MNEVNAAAARIDQATDQLRRGVLTALETIGAIANVVSSFAAEAIADTSELILVGDFAREAVVDVSRRREIMDPILVDYYDELIMAEHLGHRLRDNLTATLNRITAEVRDGDTEAIAELEHLCRHGLRDHRMLLCVRGACFEILQAAYDVAQPEALLAAVIPAGPRTGQIANRHDDEQGFRRTLNLLAHMAADPDSNSGRRARAALVELTGYIETAGEAAVRLPFHLLNDAERRDLLDFHEARSALLNSDPVHLPLALGVLRDNRVIATAVWQAFDACRLC